MKFLIFALFLVATPLLALGCDRTPVMLMMSNIRSTNFTYVDGMGGGIMTPSNVAGSELQLIPSYEGQPGKFFMTLNGSRIGFYHGVCTSPIVITNTIGAFMTNFDILNGVLTAYIYADGNKFTKYSNGNWYCIESCAADQPNCATWVTLPVGSVYFGSDYYISDMLWGQTTSSQAIMVKASDRKLISWQDAACYSDAGNFHPSVLVVAFAFIFFLFIIPLF